MLLLPILMVGWFMTGIMDWRKSHKLSASSKWIVIIGGNTEIELKYLWHLWHTSRNWFGPASQPHVVSRCSWTLGATQARAGPDQGHDLILSSNETSKLHQKKLGNVTGKSSGQLEWVEECTISCPDRTDMNWLKMAFEYVETSPQDDLSIPSWYDRKDSELTCQALTLR